MHPEQPPQEAAEPGSPAPDTVPGPLTAHQQPAETENPATIAAIDQPDTALQSQPVDQRQPAPGVGFAAGFRGVFGHGTPAVGGTDTVGSANTATTAGPSLPADPTGSRPEAPGMVQPANPDHVGQDPSADGELPVSEDLGLGDSQPDEPQPANDRGPSDHASQAADAARDNQPGPDDEDITTGPDLSAQLILDPSGARGITRMMRAAGGAPKPRAPRQPTAQATGGRRARDVKTEEEYAKRVKALWRTSAEQRTIDPQNPHDPTPAEVVQDLIDASSGPSPRLAAASFSLYRSALLWHLAEHKDEHDSFRIAYLALAGTKRPSGTKQKATSKRRGAAALKGAFAGNDLADLIKALNDFNTRDYWGSYTQYWIQATIACGARPGEWLHTSWLDREALKLQILTSKRKSAAAPFERMAAAAEPVASVYELPDIDPDEDDDDDGADAIRTIEVAREDALFIDFHLDAMNRYIAKQMADGVDSREHAFFRYYDMVRRTLRAACKVAFKGNRMYSLRSARSQFAANRKATHELKAVSGDMGHTNSRTTMSNYGPRSNAMNRPAFGADENVEHQAAIDSGSADVAGFGESF